MYVLSAARGFVMGFSSDAANLGQDGFADSGGLTIHYVTRGSGPLVVLIHVSDQRGAAANRAGGSR
jgi:hypothetical protein